MKKTTLIAALAAATFTTMPAMAEQPASATKGSQAQQKAPSVTEFDKQMAQAQENMRKMQEQMDKLSQTQDPQERQKLLQEHWGTIQNNMQMMHGMWGSGHDGLLRRRPHDGWRNDEWGHDGRAYDGMGWYERLLFKAYSRPDEAAPVHDGPIHGYAADDDGPHDAAPELHVDASASLIKMA